MRARRAGVARMSIDAPRFETERLIVRGLDVDRDFDAWAEIAADAETMRTIESPPLQPWEAWRSLALLIGHWSIRGFGFFAVEEKATGAFVGRVGPWRPHDWPGTEVGWLIGRPYWGRGYAGEAATATINWAFDALGWSEVIHVIAPTNTKSQRVAEKIGSRIIRHGETLPLKGLSGDDVVIDVWGQSAAEWRARAT